MTYGQVTDSNYNKFAFQNSLITKKKKQIYLIKLDLWLKLALVPT